MNRREKQYEDSAKIAAYALLALGVFIVAAVINNLVFKFLA